ncbi:hypothetical protein ABL78_3310 [Leptomonas seymouri]|uniref:ZC3H15/TMA46 family C-terminal domain-containing protein n=1 Tax=Leptomonas seymouri TaxID=5684 RepID=A0A0N1I7Z1_LEPSE|nr:hypothetical protein ABL78_3310 [Leptomonas seymouri]|eukprot:KPI87601.1 hypothetical protein ABL78_3310 [Leptomonas seymouri]
MGKAEQKKKEKIVEDKTFGLKNKNRSAKVQAYVQQVRQSVDQRSVQARKSQAELDARRAAKEEKRAREAELAKLFHDVDTQQRKKQEEATAAGGEGDDQYLCNPDDYLFRPEDFEEVEQDDARLEERLEAEREKLKGRTDLTPVTEESFQTWKKQKREEAAAKEAARLRKAKAGEGKMRGWDLWQMDQELFVDDEDADEFYEREGEEEAAEEEAAYDLS